jgi:hypothetical protein
MPQSQKHGFTFENEIRAVFHLPTEANNRNTHDIPKDQNIYNSNENCSIKTSGSQTICCGDILRFYNYNFTTEQNTLIVILYKQTNTHKTVQNIYEINYNKECHTKLFGNLPEEEIQQYVDGVKSIPRNIKGQEAKNIFNYLVEKNKLKKKYNNIIQINPKVDSSQSRVQCSIPNFEKNLEEFIIYKSSPDSPNTVRGGNIIHLQV